MSIERNHPTLIKGLVYKIAKAVNGKYYYQYPMLEVMIEFKTAEELQALNRLIGPELPVFVLSKKTIHRLTFMFCNTKNSSLTTEVFEALYQNLKTINSILKLKGLA